MIVAVVFAIVALAAFVGLQVRPQSLRLFAVVCSALLFLFLSLFIWIFLYIEQDLTIQEHAHIQKELKIAQLEGRTFDAYELGEQGKMLNSIIRRAKYWNRTLLAWFIIDRRAELIPIQ